MTAQRDEHERTMAFAELALGQIMALRLSASPRNFELWYNYATGYDPDLNQTINDALAAKGQLTDEDVEQIYDSRISPERVTDSIDSIGTKAAAEIESVMAVIDAAVGSAAGHAESLAAIRGQLGDSGDAQAQRLTLESLSAAGREMERVNRSLEERLAAARRELMQLRETLVVVRSASLTDALTSLANRQHFDEMLGRAATAANRSSDEPLALAFADIDRFCEFNAAHGHLIGDQVLRLVASTLKRNVREDHFAARSAGGEFAVVMPRTALGEAKSIAEQLRRAVMAKTLMNRSSGQHLGRITLSFGVAVLHRGESAQALIERAETCLSIAKRVGRNCVIAETDPAIALAQPRVA